MTNNLEQWKIFSFPDIHSHCPGKDRVLSVDFSLGEKAPEGQHFTLGIHPWNAAREIDWEAFEKALDNPMIVGIGEAGIDALKGPDMEKQTEVFGRQIELAAKHRLPLVIHSVRNNHKILELYKRHKPEVPWIIHGFRGKPEEARRLLDAGLHLSLGTYHHPDVAALASPLLHRETDDTNKL